MRGRGWSCHAKLTEKEVIFAMKPWTLASWSNPAGISWAARRTKAFACPTTSAAALELRACGNFAASAAAAASWFNAS